MILSNTIKKTGMIIGTVLAFLVILDLLGRMLTPQTLRQRLENDRTCRLCDLSDIDLAGADLTGADLVGAVLKRANLTGTILKKRQPEPGRSALQPPGAVDSGWGHLDKRPNPWSAIGGALPDTGNRSRDRHGPLPRAATLRPPPWARWTSTVHCSVVRISPGPTSATPGSSAPIWLEPI